MIFMTDTVDETFIYTDGKSVAYKGTILQFTEYPTSVSQILQILLTLQEMLIFQNMTIQLFRKKI